AIHAAQNQFPAGVIKHLAWNRVQVDASLEAAHGAQIQRQEIEEQGSLSLGSERDHLALLSFGGLLENTLQIGSLAAQPGAIVNDLAIDLAGCKIDEAQRLSSSRPGASLLTPAHNQKNEAPTSPVAKVVCWYF